MAAFAREHTCEHEEKVGQAVEIADRFAADVLDARERDDFALGAAADRAREMAVRRGDAAAGQALYDDLAPPSSDTSVADDRAPPVARREPGRGRPTKQERRAIERFTRDGEG